MLSDLRGFLKALEAAIPPPEYCHHVISYAQYGSDVVGWQDKLCAQLHLKSGHQQIFLEDSDLKKGQTELIAEIALLVSHADASTQFGVGVGKYIKGENKNDSD